MRYTDLRITNLVEYKGNEYAVTAIDLLKGGLNRLIETGSEVLIVDLDKCKPIEITKEWLMDYGFIEKPIHTHHGNGQDWQPKYPKTVNQDYVLNNDFVLRFEEWHYMSKQRIHIDYSTQILYGSEWYENISENNIYCDIKYVHQLQNLYHALTANELKREEKIKEKASTP